MRVSHRFPTITLDATGKIRSDRSITPVAVLPVLNCASGAAGIVARGEGALMGSFLGRVAIDAR